MWFSLVEKCWGKMSIRSQAGVGTLQHFLLNVVVFFLWLLSQWMPVLLVTFYFSLWSFIWRRRTENFSVCFLVVCVVSVAVVAASFSFPSIVPTRKWWSKKCVNSFGKDLSVVNLLNHWFSPVSVCEVSWIHLGWEATTMHKCQEQQLHAQPLEAGDPGRLLSKRIKLLKNSQ